MAIAPESTENGRWLSVGGYAREVVPTFRAEKAAGMAK